MTDIPGANTVPDSSAVFRLAEDQMQRLLECIHGVNLRSKPKPEPKQTECPTYDPESYRKTLEAQIECLKSNLDAANDRALLARKEIERLKAQVPEERACVVLRPYGKYYEIAMPPIIFGDRESAIKWAEDHGLEVVE